MTSRPDWVFDPNSPTGVSVQLEKVSKPPVRSIEATGWVVFAVALLISPVVVYAAWGWLL